MNINTAQVAAFGRHVVSFAMGAIAAASAMHAISPADAQSITGAVNQIVSGVAAIMTGGATLISFALASYSAWTASDKSRLAAVAANPAVTSVVVTTPALADSIPSPKVVSQ